MSQVPCAPFRGPVDFFCHGDNHGIIWFLYCPGKNRWKFDTEHWLLGYQKTHVAGKRRLIVGGELAYLR